MGEIKTVQERKDNLFAAFARKPHQWVPLMGRIGTAVLDYYGKTYWDVKDNKELLDSIIDKFFSELPSDCLSSGNFYIPPDMGELLRNRVQTKLAADGITQQHQQKAYMQGDEYPQLMADIKGFEANVLLRRKFPFLFEEGIEKAAKILEEVMDIRNNHSSISYEDFLSQKYGQYVFGEKRFMCTTPGDVIFDHYRGFQGTLTDLRRHYKEMQELCDLLWETGAVRNYSGLPMNPEKFPLYMSHIPAFLSPKQYEDLCYKYFKQQITAIHNAGSKLYILAEGTWSHLFDYIRDLPKDSILMNTENDDICDAYKAIGDHQIMLGGARLVNTKMKSLEENIDYAKKAIDTCAPGNAFVFCTDKAWCCKGDINKTLVEVYRFAEDYGQNK